MAAYLLYRVDNQVALSSGEEAIYTYWLTSPTAVPIASADAVTYANAVTAELSSVAGYKALFPTTYTFSAPKVSAVNPSTGQILAVFAGTGQWVGTGATGPLPPQCAIVVSLRTAAAGASYRGRFYLPAPLGSDLTVTGRLPTANVTTILSTWASAFTAALSAAPTCALCIYSRTLRTTAPVTTLDVGDVIDTQRRRRDKLIEVRQSGLI